MRAVEAIEAGKDFLRLLASGVRAWDLYPPSHPILAKYLDELQAKVTVISANGEPIDYIVHERSLFFGDRLLAKESLTLNWLLRRLQALNVFSIAIARGATRDDLTRLIDFLAEKGPAPDGAININSVDLAARERQHSEPDLRSAYADALDIIRDIGFSVSRGGKPALGAAQYTVQTLVDAVLDDSTSAVLMATIRAHDEPTFFHMVNVCILSVATGASMGLNRKLLTPLGMGALLHDMGKVSVPLEILNREGPLSDDDWHQIRRHPSEGAALILQSWHRVNPLAAVVAYEHHLRMDGTGYPQMRVDPVPHLLSRIVSVADTFDALTSRRSYRRPEQRQRALDILLAGAGPHYDPQIVKIFVRLLGFYPPGSVIQLHDGAVAVVVKNNPSMLSMPVVKIVRDGSGAAIEPVEIDLSTPGAEGRRIVAGLDPEEARIDPADLI